MDDDDDKYDEIFDNRSCFLIENDHPDDPVQCLFGGSKMVKRGNQNKEIASIQADSNLILSEDVMDINDVLEPTNDPNTFIIKSNRIKWWIDVPVKDGDGNIENVKMLADGGANHPCMNTEWAYKRFKDCIKRNKRNSLLMTANGLVKPKYVVWLTFPTRSGTLLKARFFLVDNLPIPVLADLNMLIAFGYRYKSGLPPIFKHRATHEDTLNLTPQEDMYRITNPIHNWLTKFQRLKLQRMANKELYDKRMNMHIAHSVYAIKYNGEEEEPTEYVLRNGEQQECDIFDMEQPSITNSHSTQSNTALVTEQTEETHAKTMEIINQAARNGNKRILNHYLNGVNYVTLQNSFLATEEEKTKAAGLGKQERLSFNNIDYIKELEKMFPHKFMYLYRKTRDLIDKYKDLCFATHIYSRRTLENVPIAELGIRDNQRNKKCYRPQYNLTQLQREYMIRYTQENDDNGFWEEVKTATHCMPYTMVAKKNSKGEIARYRPAFDGRMVNDLCDLIPSYMPTMRDFDDFFATKGLMTIADCKNYFDCIPLASKDWPWTVVLTPLGYRRMKHLAYGWKNAAPIAQNIMNDLCSSVGYMIGYIDDMVLKHPWHWGTDELITHLEKFFKEIYRRKILLHPGKFWPFTAALESMGIKRTLFGSHISKTYKKKILTFKKPQTIAELRSAVGMIQYVGRYIGNFGYYKYWLQDLINKSTKNNRVIWTEQADHAWESILKSVQRETILYNATKEGEFCIKTDASNYGYGAVLYQQQWDPIDKKYKWRIIDMFSNIIAEDMRDETPMVKEAYAVVKACEHWQFYLLKKPFRIACDNNPVVRLFCNIDKSLSKISQSKLARLRASIAQFSFTIMHVKGINNELPDGLSRFSAHLENLMDPSENKKMIDYKSTVQKVKQINHDIIRSQPIAQGYNSTDTGHKPLTNEDHQILQSKCENQSPQVSNNNQQQHASTIVQQKVFQYQTNNNMVFLSDLVHNDNNQSRFETLVTQQTKQLNHICKEFKNKASNKEYQKIKEYVETIGDNTIKDGEGYFNDKPSTQWYNGISDIRNTLDQLSDSAVLALDQITRHETHTVLPGIQTRAMKRKALREQQEQASQYRVDYVDPQSDKLTQRMRLRDNFIKSLIGYRNKIDFFNVNTYIEYQQSDTLLQTFRQLIANKITPQSNIEENAIIQDLKYYKEHEPQWYLKWHANEMRINNNGILQVLQWCKQTKTSIWVDAVPLSLRGKLVDYYHHNLNAQHIGENQTFNNISQQYYWPNMEKHVKEFVQECPLCQFVKHGHTLKAPMRVRDMPAPMSHIMADFLGPIFGKYYILVIIDYATGYTMLVPTVGCDKRVVIQALIKEWIPIFGLFKVFETDYGSGFDNEVMKQLFNIAGVQQNFAEARNHRGIGKVERIIGYIQSIINLYNVESDYKLIPSDQSKYSKNKAWSRLKSILPFIQSSINRRHPRFTQYSPNMLVFGRELDDFTNIKESIQNTQNVCGTLDTKDYQYMLKLLEQLDTIQQSYINDWQKYTHYTKATYDKQHKITEQTIDKIKEKYTKNTKVLYYIGDRQIAQQKWRQRWSGPWIIHKLIDDSTVEIGDMETGNISTVSVDRIKLWNSGKDTWTHKQYSEYDEYKRTIINQATNRHQL